jgi:hypothetical protein
MNTILRGAGGKVVGYVQTLGRGQTQVLDRNQRLVAREVSGSTFDSKGKFAGVGAQGLRLLGKR